MQAIHVTFVRPRGNNSAKVKATSVSHTVSMSYDHSLDEAENLCKVAKELAARLDWDGDFQGGTLPDGSMVFVRLDKHGLRDFEAFSVSKEEAIEGKTRFESSLKKREKRLAR